jgi:hypothetical protein
MQCESSLKCQCFCYNIFLIKDIHFPYSLCFHSQHSDVEIYCPCVHCLMFKCFGQEYLCITQTFHSPKLETKKEKVLSTFYNRLLSHKIGQPLPVDLAPLILSKERESWHHEVWGHTPLYGRVTLPETAGTMFLLWPGGAPASAVPGASQPGIPRDRGAAP